MKILFLSFLFIVAFFAEARCQKKSVAHNDSKANQRIDSALNRVKDFKLVDYKTKRGGRLKNCQYSGSIKNGKPDGKGKLTGIMPNGWNYCYEGYFVNGFRVGTGTSKGDSGEMYQKYVATWVDDEPYMGTEYNSLAGKFIGRFKNWDWDSGAHYLPDGRKVIGHFSPNCVIIDASAYDKNGTLIYSGKWINNQPAEYTH